MVGTEMLYFLVGSHELDGGAMVTASHNPKAYTGVKLVREGALALSGDAGIGEIRDLIARPACADAAGRRLGSRSSTSTTTSSATRSRSIDPAAVRPLKVVVDGGNGMAGPMVGPLLERLGLDLVETYWVPDGEFPDHEPNPLLPENRQFVIDRVLDEGADLGIAWDGDADRCFFIDDDGEFVDGDFLTALLARLVLAQASPARRSSTTSAPAARSPTPSPPPAAPRTSTGSDTRSSSRRCASTAAAFGGEVSGHYYFRDFWCADSGTLPALFVLELLSRRGQAALGAGRRLPRRATSSPARSTPRSPTRRRR